MFVVGSGGLPLILQLVQLVLIVALALHVEELMGLFVILSITAVFGVLDLYLELVIIQGLCLEQKVSLDPKMDVIQTVLLL